MNAPELKPCPFCGCPASSQKTVTDAAIWCMGCGAKIVRLHYTGSTVDWDATPRVIAAWNRRADLYDAQAAEIADLRRQLADAREVKPLEWGQSGGNWQWGNGLFNYEVVNMHGSGSFWWRRALSGTLYQPESDHTEAAAKAAALADYEARILSALKGAAK